MKRRTNLKRTDRRQVKGKRMQEERDRRWVASQFRLFKGASWLETLNLFLLALSCYWHLHAQARKFKRGPSVNMLWNADANDLCG
jgi:hypothetical protein